MKGNSFAIAAYDHSRVGRIVTKTVLFTIIKFVLDFIITTFFFFFGN